jgi:hypothetical protein
MVNGDHHSSSAQYLCDSPVSPAVALWDSASNGTIGLPTNGEQLAGEPGADGNLEEE